MDCDKVPFTGNVRYEKTNFHKNVFHIKTPYVEIINFEHVHLCFRVYTMV